MSGRILWLQSATATERGRFATEQFLRNADINPAHIIYVNICNRNKNYSRTIKRGEKYIKLANREYANQFQKDVDEYIARVQPSMIVVNDNVSLGHLVGQDSINLCRGSVYEYKKLPLFVLEQPSFIHNNHYSSWIMKQDMGKLHRWFTGSQKPEVKFNYSVTRTREDLIKAHKFLKQSVAIAEDIETSKFITCDGFTGMHRDGTVKTFVIPFFDPTNDETNGAFWADEEDEIFAWEVIKDINEDKNILKIFQNGAYDCAWLTRYHVVPVNYLIDTEYMQHSLWSSLPKKLNFLASLFVDHCRFWKDEAKGDKKDELKAGRVPATPAGLERYWRYNALDCWYTLLCAMELLSIIARPKLDWARDNYNVTIKLNHGPTNMMRMYGMRARQDRQNVKRTEWEFETKKAITDLRTMTDDPEFNPNSPDQCASLLYDVLGAQPMKTRGKKKLNLRSTDEKVLKFIALQHPLYRAYINKIWECKKPAAEFSKYGNMWFYNDRFIYSIAADGTLFGRAASREHPFHYGTNAQNIPKKDRDMFTADPGYVLFDADYSQSDAWYVAFESEEPNYIKNITDDRDTHSVHAAFYYGMEYEKIYQGHKNREEWVEHPIRGVRQNGKRITHGANYQMAAFTMYMTLGHEATVATAIAMGNKDAATWTQKQLVELCGKLIDRYLNELYPGLPKWFKRSAEECAANGNLASCFGGRTHLVFGNVKSDQDRQRELSAFFGQGGTAGNINRALNTIFYQSGLIDEGVELLLQVHDSVIGQIPIEKLYLLEKVLTIMEEPSIVKGRKFVIPVEADVGFTWGKNMVSFPRPCNDYPALINKLRANELDLERKFKIRLDEITEQLRHMEIAA